MKTVWVRKEASTKTIRRCLNCGRDISHKRRDAKFCCPMCYEGYHGLDYARAKQDMYLFNAV